MSDQFTYSSILPLSRRDELAELMFFNVQQHKFRDDIMNAIELYGEPQIVESDRTLRFSVGELGDVQTVFALDGDPESGRLVGVMLFARTRPEKLVLLHIGIDPDFSGDGTASRELLVMRLISQLRRIGRSIKGVSELEILYGARRTVIRL
ncbi:MAG: hypothetical protein QNJ73_15195 [Gammaproteobacteria bacterium]|nr:hypothetical protein [Gammaproteobacteria bacterium]